MLLLERDPHLQLLAQWHDAADTNGGCVVFVTGEAGIGKTSLVREFAQRRGAAGRVLWGVCDPLSTPQPLGPLRDVSRQVGGALLEALTQGTSRERIFSTMLDELERGGDRVVLVIEDMHWADDASLDLLKYLGRRIARTRAMLIATYRNDELDARHPLQIAIGHLPGAAVRRLPLQPLTETAVSELAQTLGRVSTGLYAATTGNPFYVTEVLAAPPGEVPASVRDAVLARIARLSPAARAVAELAALVPGRTETWLIREVLQADETAIEECRLSGMTRGQDGSLSFRHELSRRAVGDSQSPAQARTLHEQILRVLMQSERGVSESRLVHHAQGAGDGDAVLKFAPLAAERSAAVGAHREAVAYYHAALEYGDHLAPTERACLLDGLSYEHYLLGQMDEAVSARMRSLALYRAGGHALRAGDALRWVSRLNWFRGRVVEAEGFAEQAVALLEPLGLSNELAMAYSNIAQFAMLAARRDRAIHWGERAIQMAQALGSDEILAHALNNVGTARMDEVGDLGWRELERSLQISLERGFQEHVGRAYLNRFSCSLTHRDYVVADRNCELGMAYCTDHELEAWSSYIRAFRSRARFEQGAWSDALMDAEDLLSQPGLPLTHRVPALTTVGRVRARRGDDGAQEALDEAHALAAPTLEPQRVTVVAAGRAELAWLRGDLEACEREARAGLEVGLQSRNFWIHGELVFWLWRSGAISQATMPIPAPFQLHIDGDHAAAANAWASLGCRYEEAMALADSRDEAHRRRALDIFEALGARPMARRVRRELQADGFRGLKRGANRATRANPAGLTPRELEILALLADDLSNAAIARRLYLSTKTVGHHASAIFAKLGIDSRREAARAARKLGIDFGADA